MAACSALPCTHCSLHFLWARGRCSALWPTLAVLQHGHSASIATPPPSQSSSSSSATSAPTSGSASIQADHPVVSFRVHLTGFDVSTFGTSAQAAYIAAIESAAGNSATAAITSITAGSVNVDTAVSRHLHFMSDFMRCLFSA